MDPILYIRLLSNTIRDGKTIPVELLYKIIDKNSKWACKWVIAFLFVGFLICFSLPKEYRSSVQISVETSSSPVNTGSINNFNFLVSNNKDAIKVDAYPDFVLNANAIETMSKFILPVKEKDNKVKEKSLYEIINEDTKKPWWSRMFHAMMSPFWNDSDKKLRFINEVQRRILVSSGKSKEILVVETLMQDPLTSAVLCDSVVNFLNTQLQLFNKRMLHEELSFLQKQCEEQKQDYYNAKFNVAVFIDTHHGDLMMQESSIGKILLQESQIKFDTYMDTYKDYILAKFAYEHPQDRFFIILPSRVANKPMWPKKLAIMFLFGALGILWVVVLATNKAFAHEFSVEDGIR